MYKESNSINVNGKKYLSLDKKNNNIQTQNNLKDTKQLKAQMISFSLKEQKMNNNNMNNNKSVTNSKLNSFRQLKNIKFKTSKNSPEKGLLPNNENLLIKGKNGINVKKEFAKGSNELMKKNLNKQQNKSKLKSNCLNFTNPHFNITNTNSNTSPNNTNANNNKNFNNIGVNMNKNFLSNFFTQGNLNNNINSNNSNNNNPNSTMLFSANNNIFANYTNSLNNNKTHYNNSSTNKTHTDSKHQQSLSRHEIEKANNNTVSLINNKPNIANNNQNSNKKIYVNNTNVNNINACSNKTESDNNCNNNVKLYQQIIQCKKDYTVPITTYNSRKTSVEKKYVTIPKTEDIQNNINKDNVIIDNNINNNICPKENNQQNKKNSTLNNIAIHQHSSNMKTKNCSINNSNNNTNNNYAIKISRQNKLNKTNYTTTNSNKANNNSINYNNNLNDLKSITYNNNISPHINNRADENSPKDLIINFNKNKQNSKNKQQTKNQKNFTNEKETNSKIVINNMQTNSKINNNINIINNKKHKSKEALKSASQSLNKKDKIKNNIKIKNYFNKKNLYYNKNVTNNAENNKINNYDNNKIQIEEDKNIKINQNSNKKFLNINIFSKSQSHSLNKKNNNSSNNNANIVNNLEYIISENNDKNIIDIELNINNNNFQKIDSLNNKDNSTIRKNNISSVNIDNNSNTNNSQKGNSKSKNKSSNLTNTNMDALDSINYYNNSGTNYNLNNINNNIIISQINNNNKNQNMNQKEIKNDIPISCKTKSNSRSKLLKNAGGLTSKNINNNDNANNCNVMNIKKDNKINQKLNDLSNQKNNINHDKNNQLKKFYQNKQKENNINISNINNNITKNEKNINIHYEKNEINNNINSFSEKSNKKIKNKLMNTENNNKEKEDVKYRINHNFLSKFNSKRDKFNNNKRTTNNSKIKRVNDNIKKRDNNRMNQHNINNNNYCKEDINQHDFLNISNCSNKSLLLKEGNYYLQESEKLSKYIKNYYLDKKTYPKTQLNFYKFGRLIGKGAFGKVNLGLHVLSGKIVAIKSFNKEKLKRGDAKLKIYQEVNLMKNLHHNSIVKILETLETENYILIIMENISGGDLLNFIKKRTKLSEKTAKIIFIQLIKSLQYLHSKNIIHRDIKLDNILIDLNNTIKLCDFGISRQIKNNDLLTDPCGTPAYIAPEILVSEKGYEGAPVDLWSSGVVLYAMLSGTIPFKANNPKELQTLIINGKFKEISDISSDCNHLIHALLEVDPKKRITIDKILEHPWLVDVINSNINDINSNCYGSLFTKAELILLSKTNVDYRLGNKEDMIENFTMKYLNTDNDKEAKNINTKSVILAPFNSSVSNNNIMNDDNDVDKNENSSQKINKCLNLAGDLKTENDIIKFNTKIKELNRNYELNNNGEIDHGILINYSQNNQEVNVDKDIHMQNEISSRKFKSNDSPFSKENKNLSILKYPSIKNDKDPINYNKYNEDNIFNFDLNILKILEDLGYSKEYVQNCINRNELNYATSGYFLLDKYKSN